MNQPGQAPFFRLGTLDLISILGLPCEPRSVHAGPLAEVQHPRIIFRLVTGDECGVKYFRANSIFPLEAEKLRLDISEAQELPLNG